jgi:hypothetical protein
MIHARRTAAFRAGISTSISTKAGMPVLVRGPIPEGVTQARLRWPLSPTGSHRRRRSGEHDVSPTRSLGSMRSWRVLTRSKTPPPLPSSIRIGEIVFDVSYSEFDGELLGRTDTDRARIRIAENVSPPDMERDTLLHEILHALLFYASLDDIVSKEVEEQFVRRMTPLLHALIRQNKGMIEYVSYDGGS